MKKNGFAILQAEIKHESQNLERLLGEMEGVLAIPEPSSLEVRAAGSILHDFYSGIEKIFRRISSNLDGDMPSGEDWHLELLERMSLAVEGLRPSVISEGAKSKLSEFLRFRHLFRNIYGFELKWEPCKRLGREMSSALQLLKTEMAGFLDFLDTVKTNLS